MTKRVLIYVTIHTQNLVVACLLSSSLNPSEVPLHTAGPGLFRLHPQIWLIICILFFKSRNCFSNNLAKQFLDGILLKWQYAGKTFFHQLSGHVLLSSKTYFTKISVVISIFVFFLILPDFAQKIVLSSTYLLQVYFTFAICDLTIFLIPSYNMLISSKSAKKRR